MNEKESPGILLDADTSIRIMQKLRYHIQAVPDAIKILHSDEDDVENGVLGALANKEGDTEYSHRRNHN